MSFDPMRPAEPVTPESSGSPVPVDRGPYAPVAPKPSPFATAPVIAAAPTASPSPAMAPAKAKKGSSGRWLNVVLVVAAAVAIGGVAFAVGRSTAPVSAATGNGRVFGGAFPGGSFAPGASGQPGLTRGGLGALAGGGVSIRGTVESIDGDTVTIKTTNGQTIQVTTGSSTTYNTQAPATAADMTTGSTVQVQLDLTGQGGQGGFGGGRANASGAPSGPVGTAGSITVIP